VQDFNRVQSTGWPLGGRIFLGELSLVNWGARVYQRKPLAFSESSNRPLLLNPH